MASSARNPARARNVSPSAASRAVKRVVAPSSRAVSVSAWKRSSSSDGIPVTPRSVASCSSKPAIALVADRTAEKAAKPPISGPMVRVAAPNEVPRPRTPRLSAAALPAARPADCSTWRAARENCAAPSRARAASMMTCRVARAGLLRPPARPGDPSVVDAANDRYKGEASLDVVPAH